MSQTFTVEILSDEEEDEQKHHFLRPYLEDESFLSPINPKHKKGRKEDDPFALSDVVILDDDQTPQRRNPSPLLTPLSFVPETPLSPAPNSDVSFVKCTANLSNSRPQPSFNTSIAAEDKCYGISPTLSSFGATFVKCTENLSNSKPGPSSHTPATSQAKISGVCETPPSSIFNSNASLVKCTENLSNSQPGPSSNPAIATASQDKVYGICETPFSSLLNDVSFVKCTAKLSGTDPGSSSNAIASTKVSKYRVCGSDPICLESDDEYDGGYERLSMKCDENTSADYGFGRVSQVVQEKPRLGEYCARNDAYQLYSDDREEHVMFEQVEKDAIKEDDRGDNAKAKKKNKEETMVRKRKMNEEKIRLAEERKLKREQEKLQKQALKAEAVEMKKLQKEQQKWEKGKFCLKSIIAEIDTKVIELGSIGGHLLTRFAEKGLNYRITSNPIERTILWTMKVPEEISELSSKEPVIQYVLLVYEADEFCKLVTNGSIVDHVSGVRRRYPSYTICYLTNKLMSYINKREQAMYKNPSNIDHWRRPPIEEVLARFTTDFMKVHSRQCRDEAELADHVVGLTSSLATCQFRKKLTRLSTNANGAAVPKDFIDRNLIRKSPWLKALVAIPKVQPRYAVAISKKYPTMRSLLNVYMDPSKSVHEKEFLLKDLPTEGLLGNEDRRVGALCSKRVYRVLMAKNGNIKTDQVEEGADFFR